MMMDMSSFDEGIKETIALFDEIKAYIKEKFLQDEEEYRFQFVQEGNYLTFQTLVEDEVFMSKKVVFVLNKFDLINDEELVQEYKDLLFKQFSEYVKKEKKSEISPELLEKNCYLTSAGTYYGI